MYVVIIVELKTIVSPITTFECDLGFMFSCMDSIKKFKSPLQN
jgi:hypothetical protein